MCWAAAEGRGKKAEHPDVVRAVGTCVAWGCAFAGRVLGGCVPGLGGVVGGGGLCHAGRGMSVGLGARHGAAVLYYGVFVARIAKARMVCQHG